VKQSCAIAYAELPRREDDPAPSLLTPRKRGSRIARRRRAAADAEAAPNELRDMQQEYEDWLPNLPEFAQGGALEEKLDLRRWGNTTLRA
jgi:hypothetical protein